MHQDTLQAQIQRGAAWLDAEFPGWAQRIDLDTLDLGSLYTCVLAQVTGESFGQAVQHLFVSSDMEDEIEKAAQYGFTNDSETPYDVWLRHAYQAWPCVIRARKGE